MQFDEQHQTGKKNRGSQTHLCKLFDCHDLLFRCLFSLSCNCRLPNGLNLLLASKALLHLKINSLFFKTNDKQILSMSIIKVSIDQFVLYLCRMFLGPNMQRLFLFYFYIFLGLNASVKQFFSRNKAAIVKAGAVHKMLMLIESANGSPDADVAEAIVANFLALTALDANKPIIGSSGAIPFLTSILKDPDGKYGSQAKLDALRALYNLSISPVNLSPLLDADLVQFLLSKLGDMDFSEKILSILGNVASIPEGRRAVSCLPDAFPMLIDVLNWTDSPGCQEKGSYILMVMAHKSYGDRQAMIEAGITSSLLELTLLGTTLAQKRASRILECLTMDKGKQISESYGGRLSPTLSAPLCANNSSPCLNQSHHLEESLEEEDHMLSEERKAVKLLVQQSLHNNMKRIVRRANLPHDFVPSDHFKSLTTGSTSKSLPF